MAPLANAKLGQSQNLSLKIMQNVHTQRIWSQQVTDFLLHILYGPFSSIPVIILFNSISAAQSMHDLIMIKYMEILLDRFYKTHL